MHAQTVSQAYAGIGPTARLGLTELLHRPAPGIAALGPLVCKAPGEMLFAEGEEADSVYEVIRGLLRLHKLLPDGRRQITGFLLAGDLLGLAPSGVYAYTAEAVTPIALRRHKRAAFERRLDEEPDFARHVLRLASDELRAAQEQILLLGRKSAAEKVASFLLQIADRQGTEEGEIELAMTRGDIADYLGLTVETVSRTLTRLKQDALIALRVASRVVIRDRDGLESLAAGECGEE